MHSIDILQVISIRERVEIADDSIRHKMPECPMQNYICDYVTSEVHKVSKTGLHTSGIGHKHICKTAS